jgi:hypothetical protein
VGAGKSLWVQPLSKVCQLLSGRVRLVRTVRWRHDTGTTLSIGSAKRRSLHTNDGLHRIQGIVNTLAELGAAHLCALSQMHRVTCAQAAFTGAVEAGVTRFVVDAERAAEWQGLATVDLHVVVPHSDFPPDTGGGWQAEDGPAACVGNVQVASGCGSGAVVGEQWIVASGVDLKALEEWCEFMLCPASQQCHCCGSKCQVLACTARARRWRGRRRGR